MLAWLLLAALGAPAELLNAERALNVAGESLPQATCRVLLTAAPGVPGNFSLKLVYHLEAHRENDWLDADVRISPPLSLDQTVSLRVRAEQAADYLTIKLTDPDNPGANRAAYEKPLTWQGGPLPPKEWVTLELPLPADPVRRDGIDYLDFYIATSNRQVPLNQDLVFYVGLFDYEVPPRPPWPPEPTADQALSPVALPALGVAGGPWIATQARSASNPSSAAAEFGDGAARYVADTVGWNEFLHTDPDRLVLAPATTYTLQFDYTVDDPAHGGPAGEAEFYSLVRATGTISRDVGWQHWNDAAGTSGRRMVTFTTQDLPGYYLIWGVRHLGAIRLTNVQLWARKADR